MIRDRFFNSLTKAGVAALLLAGLAAGASAQNAYQGKFTLPFETRWGSTTLPAGDYTFVLPSASSDYRLYIRGEQVNAIIMATSVDERVVSGHARLNLVDIADVQNVETFEAPDLGLTLSYATHKQKHMGRQEARQNTTPATTPASRASENKTSIEVYTAGRY